MPQPSELIPLLQLIVRNSSVQFADVAAGDARGQQLRFVYTRQDPSGVILDSPDGTDALRDRRYLIASITKPVVAMLAVKLAAAGQLSLNEPVRNFLDGFHRGPLRSITIRNLLTHTSGLPDMLPNNTELRQQHATLADFVIHTAAVTPEFTPGTDCRYSSMGIAVLGEILERIRATPLANLLHEEFFAPLGMTGTWLGLPRDRSSELSSTVVPCELPPWQDPQSDWNWNSDYWRTLGAPWGGMISSADDLGRLSEAILREQSGDVDDGVLNKAAITACVSNQTRHMSGLSEADRLQRPWGFGWRLNWPDHATCFSDFLPKSAFGHWGATGTMLWIDRRSSRWCVILTNQPYETSQTVIQRMSNLIASSL